MKYSLWIPSSFDWTETADLSRMADSGDWHGIWFADHYMPNTGTAETADGDVYEAWTVLPAIAAITSRIRLGPLVSPTSVHHPALLAKRAATLDRISNGRSVLGLGAGWQINEHRAYGIDLEPPAQRVARFEEAIEIVRSLLDRDRTDFQGEFYELVDAPCQPSPVQDLLPICVGTSGNRMLRATARHAQEWNTWGSPKVAGSILARFREACEKVGSDPGSFHCSVQAMVYISEEVTQLEQWRSTTDPNRAIVGTPVEIREQMEQYQEAGFDEFIVQAQTLGGSPQERREGYDRFAAEVTI